VCDELRSLSSASACAKVISLSGDLPPIKPYICLLFHDLIIEINHASGLCIKDGPSLMISLSEKMLYRKDLTALRESGPPRFRSRTPTADLFVNSEAVLPYLGLL